MPKNPAPMGRIEIVEGVEGNGIYLVNPTTGAITTILDKDGNIDADITTVDLTATGNITLGDSAADTLDINATISDDFLVGTNKKIQFRDTGIFIHSNADGKLTISADGGGADDITLAGGLTVTNNVVFSSAVTITSSARVNDDISLSFGTDNDASMYFDSAADEVLLTGQNLAVPAGIRFTPQVVTATADGLTTGLIPFGCTIASVSSGNVAHIATLPTGTAGQSITLVTGSTGCELRTPAGSGATINNLDADGTNQLALDASSHFICECIATDTWIVRGFTALGADKAALVPDAP